MKIQILRKFFWGDGDSLPAAPAYRFEVRVLDSPDLTYSSLPLAGVPLSPYWGVFRLRPVEGVGSVGERFISFEAGGFKSWSEAVAASDQIRVGILTEISALQAEQWRIGPPPPPEEEEFEIFPAVRGVRGEEG